MRAWPQAAAKCSAVLNGKVRITVGYGKQYGIHAFESYDKFLGIQSQVSYQLLTIPDRAIERKVKRKLCGACIKTVGIKVVKGTLQVKSDSAY